MRHGQRAPRTEPRCGILLCFAAAGASAITLGFAWITVHATGIALTDISSATSAAHDQFDISAPHAPETADLIEPTEAEPRKYMAGLPFVK